MKARDVMTTTIVSVNPDTSVSAIAKTLSEHGISAVPVIDHSGRRPRHGQRGRPDWPQRCRT